MERKSKHVHSEKREPGAKGRPRSKAAEAPRDPKISAPVATPAAPKTADRSHDAAKPTAGATPPASAPAPNMAARDAIGTSKPAPSVKVAAPAAKPAIRNPAKAVATPVSPDLGAKGAPPVPAQKNPTVQPAPRPVDAAEPVRDLERAVRAATAGMAEVAKPTAAVLETMSVASPSVAARTVETGAENVRRTTAELRDTGATAGRAMTDTASTAARGWVEFNGKLLDVMRVQGDAAFSLWRETVTARSFPDAMRAQTNGLQHLYETSTTQWREVAEAAARLMGGAAKPMGAVWPSRRA